MGSSPHLLLGASPLLLFPCVHQPVRMVMQHARANAQTRTFWSGGSSLCVASVTCTWSGRQVCSARAARSRCKRACRKAVGGQAGGGHAAKQMMYLQGHARGWACVQQAHQARHCAAARAASGWSGHAQGRQKRSLRRPGWQGA